MLSAGNLVSCDERESSKTQYKRGIQTRHILLLAFAAFNQTNHDISVIRHTLDLSELRNSVHAPLTVSFINTREFSHTVHVSESGECTNLTRAPVNHGTCAPIPCRCEALSVSADVLACAHTKNTCCPLTRERHRTRSLQHESRRNYVFNKKVWFNKKSMVRAATQV